MKPLLIKGTKVSLHVESVGHEPHLIFMDSGSWCCPSLTAVRHLWAIICKCTHDSRSKEFKWVRCCQVEAPGFFIVNTSKLDTFSIPVIFSHIPKSPVRPRHFTQLSRIEDVCGDRRRRVASVSVYSRSSCVSEHSQPCHVAYLFTCLSVNLLSASAPHFC